MFSVPEDSLNLVFVLGKQKAQITDEFLYLDTFRVM